MTVATKLKHPAQYTPAIIDKVVELLDGRRGLLIDPFAGPGLSLHRLVAPRRRVVGIELEQPWVDAGSELVQQGDATALPFRTKSVSTIVTSPCYGNRFSDHHKATEKCRACNGTGLVGSSQIRECMECAGQGVRDHTRRSYTHDLRAMTGDSNYELAVTNAGRMGFGDAYEALHRKVWAECWRVARPGARFYLNVSDFIRKDQRVPVASWHVRVVEAAGFDWLRAWNIPTPRFGHGQNREARVDGEWLFEFGKAA